jgi:hypothetical protein
LTGISGLLDCASPADEAETPMMTAGARRSLPIIRHFSSMAFSPNRALDCGGLNPR